MPGTPPSQGKVAVATEVLQSSGSRPAPAPRRRRWRPRLARGHLVTVLAAVLALVLNLVALRAVEQTVDVAAARVDLPVGTPLAAEHLRSTPVRASSDVLAGLLTGAQVQAALGHVLSIDVPAGALLRAADLRAVAAPDGRRAMSLPIDPANAAGGAVTAGDIVDVIAGGEEPRYVVAGATVLAVGAPGTGLGLGQGGGAVITLAVDADEALRLAAALAGGEVQVVRATGAPPVPAALAGDAGR